ncbi:MAG: hypothetical protein U5N86_11865 [Planctomycetota bacterium]|nr:hypothetical protein [Planctomycetota bacterium]
MDNSRLDFDTLKKLLVNNDVTEMDYEQLVDDLQLTVTPLGGVKSTDISAR